MKNLSWVTKLSVIFYLIIGLSCASQISFDEYDVFVNLALFIMSVCSGFAIYYTIQDDIWRTR